MLHNFSLVESITALEVTLGFAIDAENLLSVAPRVFSSDIFLVVASAFSCLDLVLDAIGNSTGFFMKD